MCFLELPDPAGVTDCDSLEAGGMAWGGEEEVGRGVILCGVYNVLNK